MHVIKADHQRRISLEGVSQPVPRPVDIDEAKTGFSVLRSLRIYRFEAASVIDGHAEDDELLMVVLTGSVRLTLSGREIEQDSPDFLLSAVDASPGLPSVAYLPPGGAYRLTPQTSADVAYARARSSVRREPAVFSAGSPSGDIGSAVLFEERGYGQHLRLRVTRVEGPHDVPAITSAEPSESACETLVYVRTQPAHGALTLLAERAEPLALESWDTVAVPPNETAKLHAADASSALLLIVQATA